VGSGRWYDKRYIPGISGYSTPRSRKKGESLKKKEKTKAKNPNEYTKWEGGYGRRDQESGRERKKWPGYSNKFRLLGEEN